MPFDLKSATLSHVLGAGRPGVFVSVSAGELVLAHEAPALNRKKRVKLREAITALVENQMASGPAKDRSPAERRSAAEAAVRSVFEGHGYANVPLQKLDELAQVVRQSDQVSLEKAPRGKRQVECLRERLHGLPGDLVARAMTSAVGVAASAHMESDELAVFDLLVEELERAAEEMDVDFLFGVSRELLEALLDPQASPSVHSSVAHALKFSKLLAAIAVEMIEERVDRIEGDSAQSVDKGRGAWFGVAHALALVPPAAVENVYFTRAAAERIGASYAPESPGSAEAEVLQVVRRNADRFEKFKLTELANNPRFYHIDRSILIRLSEEAGSRQDAKSLLPPENKPGATNDRKRAAHGGGGQPLDHQGADFWPAEPWTQGPVPVREKRNSPHHDAGKAKWRSNRQRDAFGRVGKSQNHRLAVEALRAMRKP